jgi:hypothetical protein
MQMKNPSKSLYASYWTHLMACVVGTVILALFLGFGVAQASPAVFLEPQTWALLLALVGLVVIWWKDLLGGSLTLIGMALFYGMNFIRSGQLPGGWVFPVCIVGGLLALLSGILSGGAGWFKRNP